MKKGINRRTFLKLGSAGAAFLMSNPYIKKAQAAPAATNRVYVAADNGLLDGSLKPVYAKVKDAIDSCVVDMTGKTCTDEAWQAVFPGITASKKIGVKMGCFWKNVSPQFEVVRALVESLKSMFGGTYPASNIYLFDNDIDMNDNKNHPNRLSEIYGATNMNSLGATHNDGSLNPKLDGGVSFTVAGKAGYHPHIWLSRADYGISFVPLKRHTLFCGHITGVIKNMMGAVQCSRTDRFWWDDLQIFHKGAPYTAFKDLFANYMKNNLHLYLVDMLFATNSEKAYSWTKDTRKICMGTDPCAVDAYFADVLRTECGYSDASKVAPQALATAGIGNASYSKQNVTVRSIGSCGPATATVDDALKAVKDHKGGSKTTGQTQGVIDKYLKEETL